MHAFTTRSELIAFAYDRVSRGCQRALQSGQVEVLGGFAPLLPRAQPGWLIRVTSVNGTVWLIAVSVHPEQPWECEVWGADFILWANWVGDPKRQVSTIYEGDNRIKCQALHEEALDVARRR